MEFWNTAILIGASMLLASIVASDISSRVGVPLLLVFLLFGMLAGEDGPGGIQFDDYETAYVIGTLALAVIIFDGGLRTRRATFRVALWPAVSLAVVGVAVTAALLGAFAAWLIGLSWLEGFLLGAIVSSTDAAAVFATLRTQGAALKQRVASTLEIESGSNDPMAIFLTVGVLELIVAGARDLEPAPLLLALLSQFAIGGVLGYGGGRLLVLLINRLNLITGLYPLLAAAGGVLVYALATQLGGSGFLAIYLAGVVLGNAQLQSAQNILRVHDGLAWLSQIAMFLILGLLVTPSQLLGSAWQGLLVAVFLMLVARPLAVALSLTPFRFPWREQVYIGWMGLRGAVPIVLALFPMMYGMEGARLYFEIAFFVVLVSLLLQGFTVSPAARWLGLEVPPALKPVQRVTLDVPGHYEHEMVGFVVHGGSFVAGRAPAQLSLPEGAALSIVLRNGLPLALGADTRLETGDFIYFIARPGCLQRLGALFDPHTVPPHLDETRYFGEFTLNGGALLGEVAAAYGIPVPPESAELTLDEYLSRTFHRRAVVGDHVPLGSAQLVVRAIEGGTILQVGLRLPRP
jgi:cell volume regulation protein A